MVLSHYSLGDVQGEQSFAVSSWDQTHSDCIEAVPLTWGASNTYTLASNIDWAPLIEPAPNQTGDLQALSPPQC